MSSYLYSMKNRVRERRVELALTQAEVAKVLGVSRQTVISIENGRYLPSLPLAFRLSRLFGVPIEQIFEPDAEEVTNEAIDGPQTAIAPDPAGG